MTTKQADTGQYQSHTRQEAEEMGAFEDEALTEADAIESQQQEQQEATHG